jgi:hypothetical protein
VVEVTLSNTELVEKVVVSRSAMASVEADYDDLLLPRKSVYGVSSYRGVSVV